MPAPTRGRSRPHAASARTSTLLLVLAALALAVVALDGCADRSPAVIDRVMKNGERPEVACMSIGGPTPPTLHQTAQNSGGRRIAYGASGGNRSTAACNQSPASAKAAVTVAAFTDADRQAVSFGGT